MGAYSVAEAKAQLSALLQAVELGEEVTTTRRGGGSGVACAQGTGWDYLGTYSSLPVAYCAYRITC